MVLGSTSLRLLLEAEPACRDMLQSFHQADYAACLGRLNKLRNFLKLDIFLSDHVTTLCKEIRSRALCQATENELHQFGRDCSVSAYVLLSEIRTLDIHVSRSSFPRRRVTQSLMIPCGKWPLA
ncbi:unnamed protein product [Trichobilharzia regenti]|nr:unnamed protein product [Trichobilharzia regenti]